jgi:hypothetical protein
MSHSTNMAHLSHGQARRMAGVDVKREVKHGELSFANALNDPRSGSLRIGELVRSVPRIGPTKARAALRVAGVSAEVQVGKLAPPQRAALVDHLAGRIVSRPVVVNPLASLVMSALLDKPMSERELRDLVTERLPGEEARLRGLLFYLRATLVIAYEPGVRHGGIYAVGPRIADVLEVAS